MDNIDLNELVAGTIDSVTGKFDTLGDDQLSALRDLEAKSATKRKTLLDAIDAEVKRRAGADGAQGSDDSMSAGGASAGAAASGLAQGAGAEMTPGSNGVATGGNDAVYTQDDLDTALATQKSTLDADHELKLRNAVAVATKAAPKPTAPAKVKPATPLAIAKGADSVATVSLTKTTQVVFVGVDNIPLGNLTPMTFDPGDYEPNGNGVILRRDVEFPTTLPVSEVCAAFVTGVGGEPIGRAELVMPFGIGGGRQSKLPSGTLAFS